MAKGADNDKHLPLAEMVAANYWIGEPFWAQTTDR
jgi:hypothetical protein